MTAAWTIVSAAGFVWLGMVLAISFLEAPLKFQAPGVTIQIGLAIGRLVFRVLNVVEAVLAVLVLAAIAVGAPPTPVIVAFAIAAGILVVQLAVVRPRLNRRTRAVLAGESGARSRGHLAYVALEIIKAVALIAGGALLFGT